MLLPTPFVDGVSFELLEHALSNTPAAEALAPKIAPRRSRLRRVMVVSNARSIILFTSSRVPFNVPPAARFLRYIDPQSDPGLRDEETCPITVDASTRALLLNPA
jgi:hypothetical protein